MSSWLGYRNIDDLLTFAVNTHSASTGAATDADAVPSYRVYEDETGTAILTGSMAKLDDTNTTGFYSEQLTLSAANGFEAGKCYSVYISAAVSSVTGTTERHFSIWPATIASSIVASSVTNAVTVGTINNNVITAASIASDAITAAKIATGAIDADAIASAAITSSKFAADAINAAALATDAAEEIANSVWEEPLSDHTSGATYGNRMLRTTNAANYEVQVTNDNHISASVHDMQSNTITSSAIAAGAINANAIGADAIDASALAADAIIEIAQGVLTEATSTTTYAVGDVGNILGRLVNMIEADGADYRYTTNALEQAPGGGATSTFVTGAVPYRVKADEQFPGGVVDINVGTLMRLDLQIVDRDDNPINLTGGTVTVGVRNASTGATVGTDQSATLSLARLGYIYVDTVADWSATAGTYRITVSATLGSDVIVAGPLQLVVRTR